MLTCDDDSRRVQAQRCPRRQDCARAYAYLYRLEQDEENARYWYRRAGTSVVTGSLKAEWLVIAREFLARLANHKIARKIG